MKNLRDQSRIIGLVPLQPDILKGTVHYGTQEKSDHTRYEIPVDKVKLYITLNKKGKKIEIATINALQDLAKQPQPTFN